MYINIIIFLSTLSEVFSEQCTCVPLYQCKTEDLVSHENFGSAEGLNLWGFPCDNDFDVCCKIKCGQRQTENVAVSDIRILGDGNEASFAEFPWMLIIIFEKTYQCGGSLIHPQVALTAAHCVYQKGRYKVRAGEWNIRSRKEPLKHQDRDASNIIIHPHYNPNSLVNDVALIIVDRAFHLAEHVGVVCLPSPNSSPFPQECIVSGWGKTSHTKTHPQSILNKASFPLVPHYICERALQEKRLGPFFRLDSSFMCAGGRGRDSCKGDGGSPLICGVKNEEDIYEQFGIVSWGLVCGTTNAPGVYVSVAKFTGWIDKKMRDNGFDSEIYRYKKYS